MNGIYDDLGPDAACEAVERSLGVRVDGTLRRYSSYVNRVYGLGLDGGGEIVAKFYRPGRWSDAALRDEHRFVLACAAAEIPVVAPLPLSGGGTLGTLSVEREDGGETDFRFALYPKRAGRQFDAERDEDWLRLGELAARTHLAGEGVAPTDRPSLGPERSREQLETVLPLVHPDARDEFEEVAEGAIEASREAFLSAGTVVAHGDFHRGNVLERPGEGLVAIDFDDMCAAPAIQDLWLMLPGRARECPRELGLLAEGYRRFRPLPPGAARLVEPLRLARMIHYLAWQAVQREDAGFSRENPDWGSRSFWIKETEDLRDQAAAIELDRRD